VRNNSARLAEPLILKVIHSVILMGVYNILHSISSARTYGKKEGNRKIIKIYL
jgi:hypothetical protein